jgi:hypothetical protein
VVIKQKPSDATAQARAGQRIHGGPTKWSSYDLRGFRVPGDTR